MVLSSWQSHCESSAGSFDECILSAGWPPTLRPSQSTWTVNLPEKAATIHIHHRRLLLFSPKADTHFTGPTEGRRLSGPTWLVTYRK